MVRYCLLLLCVAASAAHAISADDLRASDADKDRASANRAGRANTGSLGSLLPGTPQSSKYGAGTAAPAGARKKKPAAAAAPKAPASDDVQGTYTPPARTATAPANQAVETDAVQQTVAFGIRLGTWMQARLERNTTSADSGSVELVLTEDVIGTRRTLPSGTTFFADKVLNSATRRLEMAITHGITPTGEEFDLKGIAFDPDKTPGLAGVYVINKKEVASRSLSKGAIAAFGAVVGQAAPGAVGAAGNAAAQSVSNDANAITDSNAMQPIIYVSPQTLTIRVDKQF